MSRLGRVTPSAGRVVIDGKACFLSLLAQAAVWLLELGVSRTFPYQLRPQVFRPWIPNSTRCQHFLSSLGAFLAARTRRFSDFSIPVAPPPSFSGRIPSSARGIDGGPDDPPRSCSTFEGPVRYARRPI